MGRYVAAGVITGFDIVSQYNVDISSSIDDIRGNISKYLNLSYYDETVYSDCLKYRLKVDVFNENIDELLDELKSFVGDNLSVDEYFDMENVSNNFDKRTYTLRKVTEESFETHNHEFYIDEIANGDQAFWDNTGYVLVGSDFIYRYYLRFYGNSILLWQDFNKINIESEYILLKLLNNLKNSCFKSKLSGAFLFHMAG